tara:strand:- start:39 stop:284 length:246 start_codon:yes stop_codon:yes gene_type:complete
MGFGTSNLRKTKEIEEKIRELMRRLEALDDLIIAKTGQHAGKTEVELDLARAIVREQDYEAAKAAYLTLKWVLQELETLDY